MTSMCGWSAPYRATGRRAKNHPLWIAREQAHGAVMTRQQKCTCSNVKIIGAIRRRRSDRCSVPVSFAGIELLAQFSIEAVSRRGRHIIRSDRGSFAHAEIWRRKLRE